MSPVLRVMCLLIAFPIAMVGCGRESRLPTAWSPTGDLHAPTTRLETRGEAAFENARGRTRGHMPPPMLIAEAKEGLGAVLTGEQVYIQRWGKYTDVPDTADFAVALGVHLGDVLRRWDFSVRDASFFGFVATAEGREDTDAECLKVTLEFERPQSIVWTVQRRRPCARGQ